MTRPARWLLSTAVTLALLSSIFDSTLAQETEETGYQEFRKVLIEKYNAGEYAEAAKMIEESFDDFPGEEWKMAYNMAAVCQHLGDHEKGIEYLGMAQDKGQFFNAWAFNGDFWAPYRETEGFDEILAKNDEMIAEAQKTSKMKIEVALPGELEEGRTYPLFIALHGGGENIGEFRPNWKSTVMESEFIIAYVQSSQVVSMTGFSWEEQEVTKKELREAYDKVCAEYPVDTAEVLIGGFSSGGYGSLVATFFEAVPVQGFVILCPPMPENITEVEASEGQGERRSRNAHHDRARPQGPRPEKDGRSLQGHGSPVPVHHHSEHRPLVPREPAGDDRPGDRAYQKQVEWKKKTSSTGGDSRTSR